MPPSHRLSAGSRPLHREVRSVALDHSPVSEEASFLEHRAALEATVFAPAERQELVLELHAGVLRRSV